MVEIDKKFDIVIGIKGSDMSTAYIIYCPKCKERLTKKGHGYSVAMPMFSLVKIMDLHLKKCKGNG